MASDATRKFPAEINHPRPNPNEGPRDRTVTNDPALRRGLVEHERNAIADARRQIAESEEKLQQYGEDFGGLDNLDPNEKYRGKPAGRWSE